MVIGSTLLIMCLVIAGIWILIEIKRLKHKIFAIFLIGLILFSYFSFTSIFGGTDINFKSSDGVMTASKIYFSWLISVAGNFKTITTNAINMDWSVNESE
ncbi:MAG: hypothetical protein OQK82_02640 [Candidatus Pacearchaeota archaeon]|nr:hypothetical protein [Candidatus Pacearchaeota archaeon]